MEASLLKDALDRPHRRAFSFRGRSWSYGQLGSMAEGLACRLEELGVEKGDRVALVAPNSPAWVVMAHGIFWFGATAVLIHHGSTPQEVEEMIARSGADLVLRGSDVEQWVGVEEGETPGEKRPGHKRTPHRWRSEEILAIVFTSGTTGRPKAVALTVDQFVASASASAIRLGRNCDEHWLCPLSLSHIGGFSIVIRSVLYGTSFELCERFDEEQIWKTLQGGQVTAASLVPTMLHQLLKEAKGRRAKGLRFALVGGGPVSGDELRRARRQGIPAVPTYGMSEACSQVATLGLDECGRSLDSAGRALPGMEIAIFDANGKRMGPQEVGRIGIKGSAVIDSYLDEEAPKCKGYFLTTDMGYVDEEGYLFVEHRLGERIVTGGKNVDPLEVERCCRRRPEVDDLVVVGVDDPRWGQVVTALVRLEESAQMTLEELQTNVQRECRQNLSAYKIPRRFFRVNELPTTATGKVDRSRARTLATRFSRRN